LSEEITREFYAELSSGKHAFLSDETGVVAFVETNDRVAIVWMSYVDTTSLALIDRPAVPLPAMLESNLTWKIVFPLDSEYLNELANLPPQFLPSTFISSLRGRSYVSVARELKRGNAATTVSNAGYYPWSGQSIQVTQDIQNPGGSHYPGGPDEWAWDFGNGTSGWSVHAARSGRIGYIKTSEPTNSGCSNCDYTTANVIVVDHGDTTSSIYMHLAFENPPRFRRGDYISAGTEIGNADQTGHTAASHLHFAVQPWNPDWTNGIGLVPPIGYQHSIQSEFRDENSVKSENPTIPTYPHFYFAFHPILLSGWTSGVIKWADGSLANGANVRLVSNGNTLGSSTTNSAGAYEFRNIPTGWASIYADGIRNSTFQIGETQVFVTYLGAPAPEIRLSPAVCVAISALDTGNNCGPTPTPNPSPPPSGWAYRIWALGNYNGERVESLNNYSDLGSLGKNDWAQSMEVNSGWGVTACTDQNYGGSCFRARGPARFQDLNELGSGLRGGLSSIKVCPTECAPPDPGNPPSNGWAYKLWPSGDFHGDAFQSSNIYADLNSIGKNDWVESMEVNSGWGILGCTDPNFGGSCYRTTGPRRMSDANELGSGIRRGLSSIRACPGECAPPTPPNAAPSANLNAVNGSGNSTFWSTEPNGWNFTGNSSDPEGRLNYTKLHWTDSDNAGSGSDQISDASWNFNRNGVLGRNTFFAAAYDQNGGRGESRRVSVNIDQAPPNFTEINVVGTVGDNGYYRSVVNVRVKAQDGCTGRACVGGERIEYARDGGSTQISGAGLLDYTEGSQGSHTISFRALDALNNATAQQNRSFIVDSVAPSPIGSISEASGSSNNVWQRNSNVPVFNWAASTDATSGVARYQLRLVDSEGRVVLGDCLVDSSATRECRPTASGLRTGTYMLRGRVQDRAGNWSTASNTWADWPLLYTFKYDIEAPQNPASAGHQGGAPNNTWQKTTSAATFTFTQGSDGNGSGVAKYYVYWGDDPAGESVTSTTSTSFAGSPLCTGANTCVGYLRVRTEDAVGNLSSWVTLFTLRYDNAPPVADMLLNNGVTSTAQTLVQVSLAANDGDGSGVKQMRISKRPDMREDDGIAASAWVPYTATATVLLPAISKQAWPVYLQVADGVNLLSEIISRTVYLDVNAHAPRSSNFWLLDGAQVAGGGIAGSANYSSFSTLDWYAGVGGSSAFSLTSGFAAGSTSLPITEPVAITYTFMSGVFGSGNSGAPMSSTNYNVQGVLGELGVPNNVISLTSVNYSLVPGFMALLPLTPTASTPITNTPPPTLTEVLPSVGCEFSTVSINNGALFTGRTAVTLSLCSPRAVEMKLSNDGGFAGAQWRPFISTTNWVLDGYATYVVQRTVRAVFKDADGHIITGPSDDIIYDPLPPTVNVSVSGINGLLLARSMARGEDVLQSMPHLKRSASGTVDLLVLANEDNSGVDCMELSESLDFAGSVCQPYAATLEQPVSAGDGGKTIYVRMRDRAGNISSATASSFVVDSEPPQGGMALADRVVGPNIVTTTLYLGADDSQSGVTDVRVGELPDLSDAVWQGMTPLRSWPVSTTALSTVTVYAQFRDAVGNLSPIYTDLYVADNTPPERLVEVRPGIGLSRTLTVLGYDAQSVVTHMRLSNDSRMLDGVTTLPYATAVAWVFDERRVVWVQLRDGVGNWSEPYPAYAADVAPLNMTLFLPAISR
jgi:murein DD-endopeptidase MepM/ murein hydrolase activator NlpD